MATARFRFVSVARYTSPIPPTPICAVTSYGPRRVPGVRAKGVKATGRLLVVYLPLGVLPQFRITSSEGWASVA
jgi:hypothetical protein